MSVFDGKVYKVFAEWYDGFKSSFLAEDVDDWFKELGEDQPSRTHVISYNLVEVSTDTDGDFDGIDFDEWMDSFDE